MGELESAQTKEPVFCATAWFPAAKLNRPYALFPKPPGTIASSLVAELNWPPATAAKSPLVLPAPPPTVPKFAITLLVAAWVDSHPTFSAPPPEIVAPETSFE